MLRATYRRVRAAVAIVAVALAATLVSVVTIDLGPSLRTRAETAGSNWLERPMHIGRLGVHIASGEFVIEDLRIEGLTPESPPWLVARRIDVGLTWGALFHREVLIHSIEMADWKMSVQSFANGRHNWPRLNGPPRPPRTTPRPVVTTMQFVRATRGEFVFDDHGSRWSVVAPNLEVTVGKTTDYRGRARFTGGTIHFQDFEPMSADMSTDFRIQGGKIVMDHIDLTTDGASSKLTGVVDTARWPEMFYQVSSHVQFPRMREIFFARDTFSLFGEGDFNGTFHLYKGGRELSANFFSRLAGINDYRFRNLEGALEWLPDRFEVTRASAEFHNGRTHFRHVMAPLGNPQQKARAAFTVDYENIDLTSITDFFEVRGIRLAGRATGKNTLEWPLGGFRDRTGHGSIVATPGAGATLMGRDVTEAQVAATEARALLPGPFNNQTPIDPVALGGSLDYAFDTEGVRIASGEIDTGDTFVTFSGVTDWSGEGSRLPFHVTSANWQESDRLLAGLMTAFGAPT